MYQVTFSDQSIGELKKLDTLQQMSFVEALSGITTEQLAASGKAELGAFNREGKTYYRLRIGDYRLYFEIKNETEIHCYNILHKHTIADFAFRSGLREQDESEIENHQSFWKYLFSTAFRK